MTIAVDGYNNNNNALYSQINYKDSRRIVEIEIVKHYAKS